MENGVAPDPRVFVRYAASGPGLTCCAQRRAAGASETAQPLRAERRLLLAIDDVGTQRFGVLAAPNHSMLKVCSRVD
jgi:hypothetical protein